MGQGKKTEEKEEVSRLVPGTVPTSQRTQFNSLPLLFRHHCSIYNSNSNIVPETRRMMHLFLSLSLSRSLALSLFLLKKLVEIRSTESVPPGYKRPK